MPEKIRHLRLCGKRVKNKFSLLLRRFIKYILVIRHCFVMISYSNLKNTQKHWYIISQAINQENVMDTSHNALLPMGYFVQVVMWVVSEKIQSSEVITIFTVFFTNCAKDPHDHLFKMSNCGKLAYLN